MFLSIHHNQTGEEYLRRLSPSETLDLREHVRKWAEREFDGYHVKLSFSEPGSYIFNGCADWQAEIRRTKSPSGSCWTSEPFYIEITE